MRPLGALERLFMTEQRANRLGRSSRRAFGERCGVRPVVELLELRTLLAAGVQLPTGQYLNELEALVPGAVSREVNYLLATDNIPGMGVAITYQGSVLLAQGYGVTSAGGAPVTASTPFDVGSITKTFTAVSTLMIVEDPALIDTAANPGIGGLQLDAPISTYLPPGTPISLPGLPSTDPTFTLPRSWADMTPRELLLMSGGLPDYLNTQPWNYVINSLSPEQAAPLFSPPGSQYYYSNEGFQVLGALIEKLTNVTYASFVQEHILTPLGMNDSEVLTGSNTGVTGQAVGYDTYDTATGTITPTPEDHLYTGDSAFSAAGIVSSAEDLAKYMRALWNQSSLLLEPSMY
jgi:CubicO group peptidase (beta-lactamase class C family)